MTFPVFMRENPRLALFSVLITASSGFGQTFFFSVFGGGIRETFALQNSTYGMIYSLATLASAILLLKLGPLAYCYSYYCRCCFTFPAARCIRPFFLRVMQLMPLTRMLRTKPPITVAARF